jgi:hypothetical protein
LGRRPSEAEVALLDVQRSDHRTAGDRDECPVRSPACSPLFHVDRRLGRDPVPFLGYRRKKERYRTAVAFVRTTNLDGTRFDPPILAHKSTWVDLLGGHSRTHSCSRASCLPVQIVYRDERRLNDAPTASWAKIGSPDGSFARRPNRPGARRTTPSYFGCLPCHASSDGFISTVTFTDQS